MTKVADVLDRLFEALPRSYCMEGDNVGLLCGNKNDAVSSVVTALDITDETIEYAKTVKANLIISHHPVIYYPLKSLTENDIPFKLANNNISAICMHTNLDFAPNGLNYYIAKQLGLKKIKNSGNITIGSGKFESIKPLCDLIKKTLKCTNLTLLDNGTKPSDICIMTGAGGDFLLDAKKVGCDTFVTGELKHYERVLAATLGMNVIIAGHYETEYPATKWFMNFIEENFKDIIVNFEPFNNKFTHV